jgi:phospholipase A1
MKRSIVLFFILLFAGAAFAEEPKPTEDDSVSNDAVRSAETFQSLDSLFAQYQPYIGNISPYEPVYFLVGANPENSAFQFSFKYRFFNLESDLVQKYPWMEGFYLAYTQTSFWDLKSDSKPFEDTSYKPEIFFLSKNIDPAVRVKRRLFIQTGFQHESNGRDEEDSRSTNFAYIKPIFIFYHEPTRLGVQISPKVWTYVSNDDDTNEDLYKYRGYFELEIKTGKFDNFVMISSLRSAQKGNSVKIDLTYPLHQYIFKNLSMHLHVQYTNSLAESLLHYQDRLRAVRIGFTIIR